jgi:hypothetical protein
MFINAFLKEEGLRTEELWWVCRGAVTNREDEYLTNWLEG